MNILKVFVGKKILSLGLLLLMGFTAPSPDQEAAAPAAQAAVQATELEGAWRLSSTTGQGHAATAGATAVRIMKDGYFTVAMYDKEGKEFRGTYGGTYTLSQGKLTQQYEFNTFDTTAVGTAETGSYSLQNGTLQLNGLKEGSTSETWERLQEENTASPLTGAWQIVARERNGQMSPMNPGPRKTMKMLSHNRFQWIAYNSETAAFSGTGGGTYTTENGKYTEHIEFFSRDSSRVGAQLTFDYEVKGDEWHHSGQSSTGNRVYEIWQRQFNR